MKIFVTGTRQSPRTLAIKEFLELGREELGFKSNNNQFTLSLKVDRSFAFSIPATETNNRIFANSNRVDSGCTALKVTYSTILYYNGGTIEGELIVVSMTDTDYSCCFYYNLFFEDLLAKKISTYIAPADYVYWGLSTFANDGGGSGLPPSDFGLYKYRVKHFDDTAIPSNLNYIPSVRMEYLLNLCSAATGISYSLDVSDVTELATKQDKLSKLMIKLGRRLTSQITKNSVKPRNDNLNYVTPYWIEVYGYLTSTVISYTNDYFNLPGREGTINLAAVKTRTDCQLTFTSLPTNPYGFGWGMCVNGEDYYTIIAGTTIDLETGDNFFFFSLGVGYSPTKVEIFTASFLTFGFNFINKTELFYNNNYYLADNLPPVTYIDLLQTTAWALGLSLYSDIAAGSFILSDLTYSSGTMIDINSIAIRDGVELSLETLTSMKLDGIVDFSSSEWVSESDRIKLLIGNNSEILYTIPFSEENLSTVYAGILYNDVFICDLSADDYGGGVGYGTLNMRGDVLCEYNVDASDYLRRFEFSEGRLDGIINSAIILKLKIVQTFFQFSEIGASTSFYYKSKKWGFVDATHQGGVTTLTILRLD